ncbi:MAG TPA: branched-chain amino acid ABC transporter permease [Candidatus Baltobacteraceae bacterium]|nr:branched-chain amino acid ABC transporter permease [Candidatus Baltobacteraceae bacterium]
MLQIPSAEVLIQGIMNGVLMGCLYALIAAGLSLIFGLMEIVNFAHGEFLMLGMYTAFWMYTLFGLDPLLSVPICAAALFLLGWLTHKGIIRRILGGPMLAQIFATFGLGIFLRAAAQFLWTPDFRQIAHPLVQGPVKLFGISIGLAQLVASGASLAAFAVLYWFITRTEAGAALEATAQDRQAAALMGINTERMFTLGWGISSACVGIAGAFLASFFYVFPYVGSLFALIAYVTVALGGFGSILGSLVAGIMIGVIEVMAGLLIAPAFKYVAVFLIYLIVVLIRPQGLFGKF